MVEIGEEVGSERIAYRKKTEIVDPIRRTCPVTGERIEGLLGLCCDRKSEGYRMPLRYHALTNAQPVCKGTVHSGRKKNQVDRERSASRQRHVLLLSSDLKVHHVVDDELNGRRKLRPHDAHDLVIQNAIVLIIGTIDDASCTDVGKVLERRRSFSDCVKDPQFAHQV